MMNRFKLKAILISTLMVMPALASSVAQETQEDGALVATRHVIGFEDLPFDLIGYIGSCPPVCPLEEAPKLVTVCKFFHAHVVPKCVFLGRQGGAPFQWDVAL